MPEMLDRRQLRDAAHTAAELSQIAGGLNIILDARAGHNFPAFDERDFRILLGDLDTLSANLQQLWAQLRVLLGDELIANYTGAAGRPTVLRE